MSCSLIVIITLQAQQRYYCNEEGEVFCITGWTDSTPKDELNPCRVPECNPPCGQNGICKAPNYCSCKIGWYVQYKNTSI